MTEGYEARGVPDTSATDGDDRDDGATDLASYERAASMAELLARLGESQEVQAIGARAGARSGAASHLMLGRGADEAKLGLNGGCSGDSIATAAA